MIDKKLNPDKHYVNKSHTKHYYLNHIFDNFEWKEFISGIRIQNISIGNNSPYRKKSTQCERWYNSNNNSKSVVYRCLNVAFYRSSNGTYLCKQCAKAVSKINDYVTFDKV
jgi:hypothetical protein